MDRAERRSAFRKVTSRCVEELLVPELGPCLVWTGAVTDRGYANTWFGRRWWYAHRLVLVALGALDVDDDRLALHRCDVKACCWPGHLYAGTHLDNVRDALARGRHSSASLKLSVDDVRLILDSDDVPAIELAAQHRVNPSTIYRIWNNRTWRHVTRPAEGNAA